MDDLDKSAEVEALHLKIAMQRHDTTHFLKPSVVFCRECEEKIPNARRRMGGVTHCIDCARDNEKRLRGAHA